jgi:hypothetical protein
VANIMTPGAAGGILPPEYQAQLEEQQRKQQIAQMLMAQGMKGPQIQQGRVASKISPLAGVANIAQAGLGGWMANESEGGASKVRQQYATDSRDDLQKMLDLTDPEAKVNYGRRSMFPGTSSIAEKLYETEQKKRERRSTIFADYGDPNAALRVLDGGPTGPIAPPKDPEVSYKITPDGKTLPLTTSFGLKGEKRGVLGSAGTNVSVSTQIPTKEADMVLDHLKGELKTRGEKAAASQRVIGATNYAVDALEQGAQAGGGENIKQYLRKGLQALGVNMPETATTEQLQQAMLQNVLAHAKEIRPASDTDIMILEKMSGNAGSDPVALTKALAFAQAMAIKDLQGYNDYANANKASKNPNIQEMFGASTSGYEVPSQIQGPPAYQMEVVRMLKQQGFDITKLKDGSGNFFPANSKFDINPIGDFPGVKTMASPNAGTPDAGIKSPTDKSALTPAEEARRQFLRKKLGR